MRSDRLIYFKIAMALQLLLYSVYKWPISDAFKSYYYFYIEIVVFLGLFSVIALHRYDRYKQDPTVKNYNYYLWTRDWIWLGVYFFLMNYFGWEKGYLFQLIGFVIMITVRRYELKRWKNKNYNRINS